MNESSKDRRGLLRYRNIIISLIVISFLIGFLAPPEFMKSIMPLLSLIAVLLVLALVLIPLSYYLYYYRKNKTWPFKKKPEQPAENAVNPSPPEAPG